MTDFRFIVFISYEDIDYFVYFGKCRGGLMIDEVTGGYAYRFERQDDMSDFLAEQRATVPLA